MGLNCATFCKLERLLKFFKFSRNWNFWKKSDSLTSILLHSLTLISNNYVKFFRGPKTVRNQNSELVWNRWNFLLNFNLTLDLDIYGQLKTRKSKKCRDWTQMVRSDKKFPSFQPELGEILWEIRAQIVRFYKDARFRWELWTFTFQNVIFFFSKS